ncbi:MAG: hypothetical protein PHD15_06160 [Clostridia bacterium]|nr:hypothetical protein [Clostridia bacterium]MDD4387314.1 hypothetical protein [Clostridia bacterium]
MIQKDVIVDTYYYQEGTKAFNNMVNKKYYKKIIKIYYKKSYEYFRKNVKEI